MRVSICALITVIFSIQPSFSAPRISIQTDGSDYGVDIKRRQQDIDREYPDETQDQSEQQSKRSYDQAEEKLKNKHTPPPTRTLTDDDVDAITKKLDESKKTKEDDAKAVASGEKDNRTDSKSETESSESPFGKIGGLGAIGPN